MILPSPSTEGGGVARDQIATRDCGQKQVRVSVYDPRDGVYYEIPTVDSSAERDQEAVEVQVRKDGSGAITKLSDVYFPATWNGEDVFNQLPLREGYNAAVPVWIEARGYGDDAEWTTVHYGWLRKIGSGGDGRLMRMRVDDYVKILETVPASQSFNGSGEGVTAGDVVSYIDDALDDKGTPLSISTDDAGTEVFGSIPEFEPFGGVSRSPDIPQSKTFTPNRDTLVDVLDWLVGKIDDAYWYVDYDDVTSTASIFIRSDFSHDWESREVNEGGVVVRKNLAMTELNPVNAVQVTGETGMSVAGVNIPVVPDDTYPVAEVYHRGLVERAGGLKHAARYEVEARTEGAAEAKARGLLEDEIGGAGEASMILNGTPGMKPFDSITAKPVCDTYVQSAVDPVTYGVERVVHSIPATGGYTTEAYVGLDVDLDDVETSVKTMSTATGTEVTADTLFGVRLDVKDFFLPLTN